MSTQRNIQESLQGVIEYYTQNPDKALSQDKEAFAVIEEGLRARATGPNGQTLVCDMPKGLGGGATAPSPGWMMRAALANCEAVMIALRAAQLGIELKTLEVRVDSLSDDRGMLGMDDSKPAGPLNMKVGACRCPHRPTAHSADSGCWSSPRQYHSRCAAIDSSACLRRWP